MNISAAINSAAEALGKAGVVEHRREAASLLAYVLKKEPVFLVAHPEYKLTERERETFADCVQRRSNREPFQYIVGLQEFCSLAFEVGPDVLIPRPETEILVGAAIEILSERLDPNFLEIGVGSGCISVSVLHTLAGTSAVGVDISANALAAAARNAAKHGVDDRLTLYEADLFDGLDAKFDLIVSNPPYIPTGEIESLQTEVRDHEPRPALAGGIDGLAVIKRIIDGAHEFLEPNGWLLIEIGFGQAGSVKELFDPRIWQRAEFLRDLQEIERVAKVRLAA